MRLSICVPYENAESQVPVWAGEEAGIDFRRDPFRACRCTLAFAGALVS